MEASRLGFLGVSHARYPHGTIQHAAPSIVNTGSQTWVSNIEFESAREFNREMNPRCKAPMIRNLRQYLRLLLVFLATPCSAPAIPALQLPSIVGDDMVLPVAVCFAWRDNAVSNLMNKEGLPASPVFVPIRGRP